MRYFIPTGKAKTLRGKEGCFATLPIALRYVYEMEGKVATPRFQAIKETIEQFYNQPDIPVQPELGMERVPLSGAAFNDYLNQIEMGPAWLLVGKGIPIEAVKFPGDKAKFLSKRSKVAQEAEEEDSE